MVTLRSRFVGAHGGADGPAAGPQSAHTARRPTCSTSWAGRRGCAAWASA
ncbi:MAG: hypothetical protein AVDCRST_MAG41-224 [uncultured Corynebacteriales bacterium]|uniref:Uncharacterized protein n=1 Tax=uncultured Mycobacteriales bacterium TaxID=581187 RepID=A0A6J4H719_9ACTN|nr:MAG: hypothetical protein AVDCRST_MAG41-224 [uncultured Corynebacteriales bacterium]